MKKTNACLQGINLIRVVNKLKLQIPPISFLKKPSNRVIYFPDGVISSHELLRVSNLAYLMACSKEFNKWGLYCWVDTEEVET